MVVIPPRSAAEHDRPILDYAKPAEPSRVVALARAGGIRVVVVAALFCAAALLPHPWGIWYFGGRPRWVVAIDSAGVTLGPSDDPALLGWFPLLAVKLLVVAVPIWSIWRFAIRRNGGGPAAG